MLTKKLLIICALIISVNISAQQSAADPFAANQTELSNKITTEWDKIWNGCNTLVKRPIHTADEVNRYMNCFIGSLPNYFRFWAEENKNALTGAIGIIEQYMARHMPADNNAAPDRDNIVRIAVHAHQRLAAWHQRTSDMSNALGTARFLVETDVETLQAEIKKSFTACSAIAKEFVNDLKEDKTYSREELHKRCDRYLEKLFEPAVRVIDKQLITMINATSRAERQYPTVLNRNGTDYREFVKVYDEFFTNIFDSLNTCAVNLWLLKREQ